MERRNPAARWIAAALLTTAFVAGTPAAALAAGADYRLGYGDTLNVSVVGQPALAVGAQPVRPDGRITLPLVQDVVVQGKTVQEVTSALARAYKPFFADAQIVVQVAKFRDLRVTLIGQVARPGTLAFATAPTLVEALANAGGVMERAERKAIKVIAPGGTQKVYDLDAILAGQQPMPLVPEGAVVEVTEVWTPDVYRWLPLLGTVITAGVWLVR